MTYTFNTLYKMENLLYSIYQQTQCTKGKINIHSKHIINQNVYMKFTYLKKKTNNNNR